MKKIEQKHIDAVKTILEFIGEDPNREGLQETPMRFLKAWSRSWGSGYEKEVSSLVKVFNDGAENADEMVIVKDIPIYSHCEHHIAPIVGTATIAYIPNGKIIGLSKIARLADMFARRLQVQERLTNQIADALEDELNCLGVGVHINAQHLCMTSRGIQSIGSTTTTNALRGVFKSNIETRQEFLNETYR